MAAPSGNSFSTGDALRAGESSEDRPSLVPDIHDEDEDDDDDEFHELDDEDDDEEEEEEEEEEEDEEDDEDDLFHDAEQGAVPMVVGAGSGGGGAIGHVSRRQVLEYLRRSDLGRIIWQQIEDEAEEEDEDGDEGFHSMFGRHRPSRRRRHNRDPNRFPKVPSDKGRELMNSGVFGATDLQRESSSHIGQKKRLARRILDRELGIGNGRVGRKVNQDMMAQSMIPTTSPEMTINYDQPVYSGQFSDDGNFFYSCVKDFKVRMYDTSNPYAWRHYKTVPFLYGTWTLTDASLSPDNRWLAYTSIQSDVSLAPTDPNDTGDPYILSLGGGQGRRLANPGFWGYGGGRSFGIWSIRFSGDGRELVAGTNANSLVVFDIETRTVLHQVHGHQDDVNAVCFADKSSPHILYSGSDDATIKVWDRRSLGDGREAGAFVGHVEGLTYIDSKGDGRYILSNSKDQSMKLWDLKMMYTTSEYERRDPTKHTRHSDFDYRYGEYDDDELWFPHPDDNSVVTFRGGHRVLGTLIRCHFSPPGSTDSRYVYSGSFDGKVYVYNLDATLAGTIDVRKATEAGRSLPRNYRHWNMHGGERWQTCVRDASWHPTAPVMAASALNGWGRDMGTVTVHSYNENGGGEFLGDEAEPPMGVGYDEKLRKMGGDQEGGSEYDDGEEDEEDDDDDDDDIGWVGSAGGLRFVS